MIPRLFLYLILLMLVCIKIFSLENEVNITFSASYINGFAMSGNSKLPVNTNFNQFGINIMDYEFINHKSIGIYLSLCGYGGGIDITNNEATTSSLYFAQAITGIGLSYYIRSNMNILYAAGISISGGEYIDYNENVNERSRFTEINMGIGGNVSLQITIIKSLYILLGSNISCTLANYSDKSNAWTFLPLLLINPCIGIGGRFSGYSALPAPSI